MGHGSPRSLSSRRWWMRTRLAGLAGSAADGPVPYGAATSAPLCSGRLDIVVDHPSLEARCGAGPRVRAEGLQPKPGTAPFIRAGLCDETHMTGPVASGTAAFAAPPVD